MPSCNENQRDLTSRDSVLYFCHRIGPYHKARFDAASKLIPGLVVCEWSKKDTTYKWDEVENSRTFEVITLYENEDVSLLKGWVLYKKLEKICGDLSPRVLVVNGWGFRTSLAEILFGLKKKIPMVVLSESTAWDETKWVFKEWMKRRILGCFSSAFVGGREHSRYLIQLGMAPEQVCYGYDVVDNRHFEARNGNAGEMESNRSRVKKNNFLASGRFIEKKNFINLIRGFAEYHQKVPDPWDLVLLGDGENRAEIVNAIKVNQLENAVILPGFIQYTDLPSYYHQASVFIHPSIVEPWGLVVNEAMAAGLPVLVSHQCGCARELVREGVNGYTFDPGSTKEMAECMMRMHRMSEEQRLKMGKASLGIIEQYSPETFAHGLKNAVEKALDISVKSNAWSSLILQFLSRVR